MIDRALTGEIELALQRYPAVAILGPRQVGKTTLALSLMTGRGIPPVYLGLERPSDRASKS